MDYNVLKRTIKQKNKTVSRWYYSYIDPITKVKKQRVIPDCKNKNQAYAYVNSLPEISYDVVLIKDIAKDMFVLGSEHLKRLEQHGQMLTPETLLRHRSTLDLIVKLWGELQIKDITVMLVDNYLTRDEEHGGSWKNSFLETLGHLYKEAPYYGINDVIKPTFRRFKRNCKKADIFTTDELAMFFNTELWSNERDYLVFLCMASFGLRMGEARALKPRQFIFDRNALVVDGFCKSDGMRTDYNKKGSDEDKKWRVSFGPASTMRAVKNSIEENNIADDDFLFQREGGVPLRREYLEEVFRRRLKIVGINEEKRKLIPHSFRFTYVTRMRRNAGVETVQKLAGHTSIEMTEYYTRAAIPEMIEGLKDAVPAAEPLFA